MDKWAIIVAGGSGSRMKLDEPKQFHIIGEYPLIIHTVKAIDKFDQNLHYIIVASNEYHKQVSEWINLFLPGLSFSIASNGSTRFYSVLNGLNSIEQDQGTVLIHDAVRPFVSGGLIKNGFEVADKKGSALPVIAVKDSLRLKTGKVGSLMVDRNEYCLVQTPQFFSLKEIKEAYKQPYQNKFTDDANVYESAGYHLQLIEGEEGNFKITNPYDMKIAEGILLS